MTDQVPMDSEEEISELYEIIIESLEAEIAATEANIESLGD